MTARYGWHRRIFGARLAALAAIALLASTLRAQLTTGIVEGVLHDPNGHGIADAPLVITGGTGLRTTIRTKAEGEFSVVLPYGQYSVAGISMWVTPLQVTRLDLAADQSGDARLNGLSRLSAGVWTDAGGGAYPEGFSVQGMLLSRDASSATQPLDFSGLSDNRLTVESQRGLSWTTTQYTLQGMDATDSYQPGSAAILPDIQALEAVVSRGGFAEAESTSNGAQVGLFLRGPGTSWHGAIATNGTAAGLASPNLPAPAARGQVQQPDQFRWLTRDSVEAGGPVTKWADVFASIAGQWSSQTMPLVPPGTDQQSRTLFWNLRTRVRAGQRDQFDVDYSGSSLDLSGGGIPAGLEALTGFRMAPSFVLPGGFQSEAENDRFGFLQAGWTHRLRGGGAI